MKLDLEKHLNQAQLRAVTTTHGPILVIAGAGSGKTRTVVYRLAHLVQLGIDPQYILLLTFTRKVAHEMLIRASRLIGQGLHGVSGGTFHSFAYTTLRRYGKAVGLRDDFTVMDRSDCEEVVKQVKELHKIGKGDRAFPKKSTIVSLISKSRNKERDLEYILEKDDFHFLPYLEDLKSIFTFYQEFKNKHALVDYDDLLFYLEQLLLEREDICEFLRLRTSHIMVDEYQDTNLVQGRIVKYLSSPEGNIMVVGDDAQSIYSFRGATVSNILQFTKDFPQANIIKLEQNYRSTQPILHLSNQILIGAKEKYEKKLFSTYSNGSKPQLLRAISDQTQADIVLKKVKELSQNYPLHEIAILFRAGFQSFHLEIGLNKIGIRYQKFGGIKFTETAHIKDVLAHLRLVINPLDLPAWQRAISLIQGIGPKTSQRLYESIMQDDRRFLQQICSKKPTLKKMLELLTQLRNQNETPYNILEQVLDYYQPLFQEKYPDDYPKRKSGLDQLSQIASMYDNLDTFLSDMSLENPEQIGNPESQKDILTLSTVHSAKGLEWSAVLILDLIEDRFPSRHAMVDAEAMEEERRLFYVACTRAKSYLGLCVPESLYNRFQNRKDPAITSPFIQEINTDCFEELRESYLGNLQKSRQDSNKQGFKSDAKDHQENKSQPTEVRYCKHKIFGKGKVIGFIPPNKYKVNFPGFGLKVIIGDYLHMEQ